MTLGAAGQVRLIVWCKACQHQVEPGPGRDGCSVPFWLSASGRFVLLLPAARRGKKGNASTAADPCLLAASLGK